MKFYMKEMLSTPLALPSGKRVRFEPVGDSNTGLLSTEDEGLIIELDKAAAARTGGVVVITAEQAEQLKKKPPVSRLRPNSLAQIKLMFAPENGNRDAAPKIEPQPVKLPQPSVESEPLSIPTEIVNLPKTTTVRKARFAKEHRKPAPDLPTDNQTMVPQV